MEMFRVANAADSNVKLYLNDYGLVSYPEMAVVSIRYSAAKNLDFYMLINYQTL